MVETRKELRARLQAAGLWNDYLALRDRLARDGLTAGQARKEALRQIDEGLPQPSVPEAPQEEAPQIPDGANEPSLHEERKEGGPDLSELVIRIPAIEKVAWEQVARETGLSLTDWVRARCGQVTVCDKAPLAPCLDGRCRRCSRLGKQGCPDCPKNLVVVRALTPSQVGLLQQEFAEGLRREQRLRERIEELEGNVRQPFPARVYCPRCLRLGPMRGCAACERLRTPALGTSGEIPSTSSESPG